MKESVEVFSLRLEWRSPPWIVQNENELVNDEFDSVHWGTLFEGIQAAWLADRKRLNPCVQNAIQTVIPGCQVLSRKLPRDAAAWLVKWGNKKNDHKSITNILEVLREVGVNVESAWHAHKETLPASTDISNKKSQDERKLKLANYVLSSYKFKFYVQFERANTFYRDANKVMCKKSPNKDKTVWALFHARYLAEIDGSQLRTDMYENTIHVASTAMRLLKRDCPDEVVEITLLTLPRRSGPWGQSMFLPAGLPLLRSELVNDPKVKLLISSMANSKVVGDIDAAAKEAIVEAGQGTTAKGKRGRPSTKGKKVAKSSAGSKSKPAQIAEVEVEDGSKENFFAFRESCVAFRYVNVKLQFKLKFTFKFKITF